MFAAHAFADAGWDVAIFSIKRQSHMFGAQYLHAPIPGLPEVKRRISYELIGTPAEYRQKVYGAQLKAGEEVSPNLLVGEHDAWDIRAAYDEAYARYESRITPTDRINGLWYATQFHHREAPKEWGVVVSTIPAPDLCGNSEHQFYSMRVWGAGDAPEQGKLAPLSCAPDKVICNGSNDRAWYRLANVFDHTTVEWPFERRPPISGIAEIIKPLRNNCRCHQVIDGGKRTSRVPLHRMGRYGLWQKGVLSHHAYETARGIIEAW
jgi:hypothetical protein